MLTDKLTHARYRFQWAVCQLERLRLVFEPDVQAILAELPATLDETYKQVINDINQDDWKRAYRLLHCLAFAVRPLSVEELAEILTFDFDAEGIPQFRAERRREDQEEAVLSLCSSLVTIVDDRGSRVVKFSHDSVKEFLISKPFVRHNTSYHICAAPAHTVLAQVCLSLLLHPGGSGDKSITDSPLAEYATRHWITHAQFEDVARQVGDGMKALFDLDQPHFMAWIGLYDIDTGLCGRLPSEIPRPLYYAALCGFHDLVQHIYNKRPQDVRAMGGEYGFPIFAAQVKKHSGVVMYLRSVGGSIDAQDIERWHTSV
jgi:hypothetical protein